MGILHNPDSGGNRGRTDQRIRQTAERFGAPLEIVRNPREIERGLDHLAEREVKLIALNGGDGTIQAALTILQNKVGPFGYGPPIALLHAGTTAMTTRDMGLTGRPPRALYRLLKWASSSGPPAPLQERNLLRVQAHPEARPLFGFFLGAAAIAKGVEHFHRNGHRLRSFLSLGPTLVLLRGLLEMPRSKAPIAQPVPIALGDKSAPGPARDYLLFFATTLRRLMLGMTPFWGTEPGPIQYTGIEAPSQGLLRNAFHLVRGQVGEQIVPRNGYHSHNTSHLELTLASALVLDGEIVHPDPTRGPVTVEAFGPVSCLVL